MSLEDYASPSQVSVNTKRLSAMIDSLHGDQDDDEILRVRNPSPTSTPSRIHAPHAHTKTKSNQGSPTKLPRSPAGVVSLNSPDRDHRASMLSSYSGVVQEGVGICVVRNVSGVLKKGSQPKLPTFPSEETLHASRKPTDANGSEEVILKSVADITSRRGPSSGSKFDSRKSSGGPQQGSLKLLSVDNNKKPIALSSSIGSGNMASESGSSTHKIDLSTVERQKVDRISTPQVDSDTDSIATSIIPEVATTKRNDKGIPPIRSETTNYNPAIPPRSRNRPTSRILIQDDEDHEPEQNSSESNNLKIPDSPTRGSSVTNKSDTYYSASSFDVEGNRVDVDLTVQDEEEEDPVDAYLSRPLPTVPQPAEVHRDSTIKREQGREPEVVTTLASSSMQDHSYESDEQYEYIDESGRVIESTVSPKSSCSRHTKGRRNTSKKKKQQELRQFDVDTLSQLLNVTKGTLIGAEFANLGMKIEEKRALERLVDSLSRLTADMVLDPDRYEEGLKRLNKATKALEGF
ncbi:BN860_09934g1_1 [Zygosaccharomyces bailii CLIB 213]|uniref:BN860_09934g1_1 n=1 Tax=Zygosaccharomyces bailii (strain CLIB 213 / ATCC 58445 / CBS 680 / BCRC 21525 / NBRC 1098 / NCYC 1416 / NRRL Y-2227) TaxID=1333698 RepID=A0A8J2T1W9_ZYGB2|nr:BN860_09934g1_1 [Zygosaccharomyces bailii CLIB 213]